jgi:uncharacterized membrane protein
VKARVFFVMTAMLLAVAPAEAYIGPGPALGMMGALFNLLMAIAVAVTMVLAYPLRALIKRRRAHKPDTEKKD